MSSLARRIRVSHVIIAAAAAAWMVSLSLSFAVPVSAQGVKNAEAAKLKNPVKSSPESITAGKTAYDRVLQVLPQRRRDRERQARAERHASVQPG